MKTGFEVFDFKEKEELAEHGGAKLSGKFKNPSIHDPVSLSCEFVECVSQESDVPSQKLNGLASMDVDASESDHTCDADDMNTPMKTMKEDMVAKDGTPSSESDPPLGSPIHQQESHSRIPSHESRSFLVGEEARESCFTEPCSEGRVLNDPSCSPSSSVPDDERSDDECMNDDPPSRPAPNIAEENAVFDNISLNHHFSCNSGMDGVSIAVDYVLYRDNYFTGCLVTFSCSGIKINGSTEVGDKKIFSLQKEIDDIIRIESHHLDRMGTVNVKLCFLLKGAGQADCSGAEELEFAAVGPNWSEILHDILSMNAKYFSLWSIVSDISVTDGGAEFLQQKPYFPKFDESFEDVIYPKGDSDAVSISKRDVDLLQPDTFINDTIIDFYIKYLKSQIPPAEKCRFHFFNSFFFRKLADMDKDPKNALDGRAAFLRVQKWTRKVDMFGKDYIFIPVNFNLHWSLLVICHPGETANFKDEDADKSLKVPCILHLDSIRGTHDGLRSLVQNYLWEEWKSRQKEVSEESSKFLSMRFVSLELPQQENSFDCGLFLLHYLELFLVDAPVNFSPFRINDVSKFLNVEWFPPAEASLKRTLIERLIYELLKDCHREVASGACSYERQSNMLENNENEEVGQGIEITLLASSSMRNTQCVNNDQGLVFREFLNSGVPAGALLAPCAPFDQSSSFYRVNGPVSQMEHDVEAGEQFEYYSSEETVFQQFNGLPTPTGSIPYSLGGFRNDNTWNPGISAQEDDTRSSAGTSVYDSDDSDVGIIENFPTGKIAPQLENTDQEQSSPRNGDPVTDVPASAPCEISETCVDEGNEEPEKMQNNDNTNSSLASSQENPTLSMQEPPIWLRDGIHCHIEEAKISGNNLETIVNQLKSNVAGDEVQSSNDDNANTGADLHGSQTIEESADPEYGSDVRNAQENVNTDVFGSDVQTTNENPTPNVTGRDVESTSDVATVTRGDSDHTAENFSGDSEKTGDDAIMTNINGNDFQTADDITTNVNGNDEQRSVDDMTTDFDEQQASKRRKLTSSVEAEQGPMGSLLNDLDMSNDIRL